VNPRLLTPLVSAGAAWATRKGLNAAYAHRHEGGVPTKDDTQVPFRRVLMWSLATAVVVALVDVAIQQSMARWADRKELPAA
jgi:hypothetical protein